MKKNINIILFCTIICLVFGCANAEIDINENADEMQLQTLNQNAVDLCELDSNNITKIKTFNGVPHETVVL